MKKSDKDLVKIPIVTYEELIELGNIMHYETDDELLERRFWKKVYGNRGLKYIRKRGNKYGN